MSLMLFATDLDGTLLPNAGPKPASGCLDRTRALLQQLRDQDCLLCYTCNRGLTAARKGQRTFRLPEPDYWICHLGTEIYHQKHLDKAWQSQLGEPLAQQHIRQSLAKIPGLVAQESSKQSSHKFSWYYAYAVSPEFRANLLQRVNATKNHLRLVYSLETSNQRAILDFIPDQAGNAGALYYLMQKHHLSVQQTFFAGDSGTDIDACIAGFCAGVVGNALDEVKHNIDRLAQRVPSANSYTAKAYYGDGIIESLHAHHLLTSDQYQQLIPPKPTTQDILQHDNAG